MGAGVGVRMYLCQLLQSKNLWFFDLMMWIDRKIHSKVCVSGRVGKGVDVDVSVGVLCVLLCFLLICSIILRSCVTRELAHTCPANLGVLQP